MDALAELALGALDAAVAGLLPAGVPPGLTRSVRVLPMEISSGGLGGYIGTHTDPRGDIVGRRIDALVEIAISGGTEPAASDYLKQVVRNLLVQDRGELRREGISRLRLDPTTLQPRGAQVALTFEYRHLPTASEGVIRSLDLSLDLNLSSHRARYLWDLATRSLVGTPQPLADFTVADDPDVNAGSPPSQWTFNVAEARIEQNAAVRGGPLTLSQPKKAGAQLLWRPGSIPFKVERLTASMEFDSTSQDGVGLVFGRENDQNFWFFLASQRSPYHLFGRKKNGSYGILGQPATHSGFTLNARHVLTVAAYDGRLISELDGTRTLDLRGQEPTAAGEVGFLTHGNNGSRFYRARLVELGSA